MTNDDTHTVLARKLRPQNFAELIGQDHITSVLKEAISRKKFHHAYLLTGPRGVGKTSMARILSKCLNCESGPIDTPCNTCEQCTQISQGLSFDTIEIDAASKSKVDDIKEFLEHVCYSNKKSRYKILIIDEIHMLSMHSFNALLKVLEEPQKNLIFIMATTEQKKIPLTIISRCLHFCFKKIDNATIKNYALELKHKNILQNSLENIDHLISSSDGSLRDFLNNIEKLPIASIHEDLDHLNPEKYSQSLLQAIIMKERESIQNILKNIDDYSVDIHQIFINLLEACYNSCRKIYDKNQEMQNIDHYITFYHIIQIGIRQLEWTHSKKIVLEMIIMQLLFQVLERDTVSNIPLSQNKNTKIQISENKNTKIQISENKNTKIQNSNSNLEMQKEKSIKMINNIFDSEEIIL
jgi:DNA polymerase III subunit gamma/tau